jgi:hypothetical protein
MREEIQVFVERLCDAAGFELDVAVEPSYNDSGDFRDLASFPTETNLIGVQLGQHTHNFQRLAFACP